ncbi:bromodomain-containing protein 3 [Drosophila tropicalis]|uniref:bromodomain-containing protein 3 n=1 Tax=Drosophila tropicalis TaxID=46794 RepID=UPI0035ABD1E8
MCLGRIQINQNALAFSVKANVELSFSDAQSKRKSQKQSKMEEDSPYPRPAKPEIPPRIEPYMAPVNGIVQPPVVPPPNRPGRRTNVMEDLKVLLNSIWKIRWSYHFRKPVDAITLGIPDYHAIIKYPMDLATIKKRLNNNYYWQADEALEDFELIFENCMLYNMEGTPVYAAGTELRSEFYTRLAFIDMSNEVEVIPKPDKRKRKRIECCSPIPIPVKTSNKHTEPPAHVKAAPLPVKEVVVERIPPPAPVVRVISTTCYKNLDRLIEKSHCDHLLKSLIKRKRRQFTWAFNSAEVWRRYSQNPNYDHDMKDMIDWRIIQRRLNNDEFENLDSFVYTVRKMCHNAIRCFPDDHLVKTSAKKTNEIFEDRLSKYRELIAIAKSRARELVSKLNAVNEEEENASNDPVEPKAKEKQDRDWSTIGGISKSLPSDTQLWPEYAEKRTRNKGNNLT